MANLKTWLLDGEREVGETIEAVTFAKYDSYRDTTPWADADALAGRPVDRDTALAAADVEFSSGYGGAGCPALWAWTATALFIVCEYDGATRLQTLPRNPRQGEPTYG